MPSSMVKAGRTLAPVVLSTVRVSCSTVASWPVVRTDWIDRASGLAAATAAVTAAALIAVPARVTGFQCRPAAPGGRPVVAAAVIAAGISITR